MASSTRTYDSPRRRAQAAATRAAVLDAAAHLFSTRGYGGTTMAAVAAEAGVAVETVYTAVGPKRRLLVEWVDRSVAGDDRPVPVLQRDWVATIADEHDQRTQLRLVAAAVRQAAERAGAAFEVFRRAADTDPELAALWDAAQRNRLEDQTALVRLVAARGPLRDGLDVERAADVVWTVASPDVVRTLVHGRGWSHDAVEAWLADALVALLLP